MWEKKYCIEMQAPLGIRMGTLLLRNENGCLEGTLYFLDREEKMVGVLRDDGMIKLKGMITTAVRSFPIYLEGQLMNDEVNLIVKNYKREIHIKGKEIHEEIL